MLDKSSKLGIDQFIDRLHSIAVEWVPPPADFTPLPQVRIALLHTDRACLSRALFMAGVAAQRAQDSCL